MIFDPAKETKLHRKASSIGYGVILFQKMNGKQRVFAYSIGGQRRRSPSINRISSKQYRYLIDIDAQVILDL